jgi:hypothetical protein
MFQKQASSCDLFGLFNTYIYSTSHNGPNSKTRKVIKYKNQQTYQLCTVGIQKLSVPVRGSASLKIYSVQNNLASFICEINDV